MGQGWRGRGGGRLVDGSRPGECRYMKTAGELETGPSQSKRASHDRGGWLCRGQGKSTGEWFSFSKGLLSRPGTVGSGLCQPLRACPWELTHCLPPMRAPASVTLLPLPLPELQAPHGRALPSAEPHHTPFPRPKSDAPPRASVPIHSHTELAVLITFIV